MFSRSIYRFGRKPEVFEIDLPCHRFTPSLTDQTYYVVNSEVAKLGETMGTTTCGCYDNSAVSDDVANLRRPGLDVTEAVELVDAIKFSVSERVNKDIEDYNAKVLADVDKQKSIDNVLNSVVNSNTQSDGSALSK